MSQGRLVVLATPTAAESPTKLAAKLSPTSITASPQPLWSDTESEQAPVSSVSTSEPSPLERELYSRLLTALMGKLRAGHVLTKDELGFLGVQHRATPGARVGQADPAPAQRNADPVPSMRAATSAQMTGALEPVLRKHTHYGITFCLREPAPRGTEQ
jgi:hypothetical protein